MRLLDAEKQLPTDTHVARTGPRLSKNYVAETEARAVTGKLPVGGAGEIKK